MGYSGLTLCTDGDLGAIEPEATNGHWGKVTWPNQRAEAKRDLKIWLERDFVQIPDVADKILDTHAPDAVWGYTGGTFSDLTSQARTPDDDDLDLSAVFVTVLTDRLYIGVSSEFDGIALFQTVNDTRNAVASTLTVKYSGPSGWTTITAVNGTLNAGASFAQSGRITWTVPSNWVRQTLDNSSEAYFWIEITASAVPTTGTSVSQLLPVRAPDALKRIVAWQALGYIYTNLAAQAPSTDYWAGRASNQFKTGYFDKAVLLYESLLQKGGLPIDLDDDNVIDPEELNIVSPVIIGRA